MFGIHQGPSFFSAPNWVDPTPRMTPEGPRPRTITLATVASNDDPPTMRLFAEHDGWPDHCPDPRCAGGMRCRGARRRLAPHRPRDYPSCYAFALAALIHREDLAPVAWGRAAAMMPMLIEGEDESEVGGPARGYAGPLSRHGDVRLAERLLILAVAYADGGDPSELLAGRHARGPWSWMEAAEHNDGVR